MWPSSSWDCVSPDTCVRCAAANFTSVDDVDSTTCLYYNKFTCLCDYKDPSIPCVHQEVIDECKITKVVSSVNDVNRAGATAEDGLIVAGTSGFSKFVEK